ADSSLRSEVRKALEAEGHSVLEAADRDEALDRCGSRRPQLVLADLDSPGFDPGPTFEALRGRCVGEPPLILALTESQERAVLDAAYEAGAGDFVPKPIDVPLLVQRVRCLLRNQLRSCRVQRDQRALAHAQQIAHLGSFEWNTESDEMTWSPETFRILGFDDDAPEPSFERFLACVHPDDRDQVEEQMSAARDLCKSFSVDHRVTRPDGEVRSVHQLGEWLASHPATGTGGASWVTGTIQDVTDQRRAHEEVRYLANFDSLTGLANRRHFKETLEAQLEEAKQNGHLLGLLYMDLDQFKRVNDTLGHSAGDQLLQNVAELLRKHIRGSDLIGRPDTPPPALSVSRLGGDEFTILLSGIESAETAGDVARRVLRALPEPVSIGGYQVSTTGSIGIAIYPVDGEDVEALVKHADTAMYHAKNSGRNNFQFFSRSMNSDALRKLSLEARLRQAIENDEMRVEFQPKVNLRTRKVTGAEALLRWEDAELGTVSPKEIIPLAEDTGLIDAIGVQVLEAACSQVRAWQKAGYRAVPVAVNVSSRQLIHRNLHQTVSDALQKCQLDPTLLEIEITESAIMQDDEEAAIILRDLRAIGVRIALDDFGTGYSSLSYLTRFPLDTLKMDRCLVRELGSDPAALGIARAVIDMAHSLKLRVVAEGVDAEEQAELLEEQGCDEMQGFLFSAAVPGDEFTRFLEKTEDDGGKD
ncbi:MAG: EAL domain-containing protein, partial [Myxococcota bacterium]